MSSGLAQRTHDSTEEVSSILGKLMQQTEVARQTMEKGTSDSSETLKLSDIAKQTFNEIETIVQNIRDMTTQTASATEEHHLVT